MDMKPLYQLVHYDVFRLFWLFFIVWMIGNFAMYMVEKTIWGAPFTHWGDLVWLGILSAAFGWTAFDMGQNIVIEWVKKA